MTLKLALAGALLLAGSAAASAHDPVEIAAPLPNPGNTAWMMTATILVLAMTVPGLALFYAGMVRAKNVLSVLMQVLIICAVVMLIWVFYGHRPPLDARSPTPERPKRNGKALTCRVMARSPTTTISAPSVTRSARRFPAPSTLSRVHDSPIRWPSHS